MDSFLRWWRGEEDVVYVDVEDYLRKRQIRDAEFQHAIDAQSKVQRVSGKVPAPVRRIPAVMERGKG